MLHVSVSSLSDFMACRRMYYWRRIKRYDKGVYKLAFVTGRVIHEGMGHLLAHKANALSLMTNFFKQERKQAIEQFGLDPKAIEELDQVELATKGMLSAYAKKYAKNLSQTKLLGSEVEGAVQLGDNVTFVIKLDNIILVRGIKKLHELKSSKYITPDYIKHIQTDRQTAQYFYFHNIIYEEDPLKEIVYDVIRKPSIRQKKAESKVMFLERLQNWYDKPGDESVFHMETFKAPKNSEDETVNTVVKVSEEMLKCKTKEDYYQNTDICHSYYGERCPYYELCHDGGEIPENLVLYSIRKPYHVSKENKGVKS
jgi:hypothetical protein